MNSEDDRTNVLKTNSNPADQSPFPGPDDQTKSAQPNFKADSSPVLGGPASARPVRRLPLPPPIPRKIDGGDELWRNASKLAKNVEGDTIAMNATLDTTLIFAGLFSAVNSTLLAISLSSLSPGSNDETNALLRLLVVNNVTLPEPTPFKPTSSAVLDNLLFSTSLLFSLFAAFGAVLGKQWLVYNSIYPYLNPMREADQRIERMEGARKWKLRLLLELLLPALLQIALAIFILGMVDFFWGINMPLGIWCCMLAVTALAVFFATVILAIKFPECPFQSPLSMIVWPAIRPYVKKLPVWFDLYFPDEPFERPSIFRGWPTFHICSVAELIGPQIPKFLTGDPQLLANTIRFTLERTDQLKDALPAVLGIPTITSRDSTIYLCFWSGGAMMQFFKEAIVQLDREASTGYSVDSLTSAILLARGFMHFYLSGTCMWQTNWIHWFTDTSFRLSNLPLPDTELAYLKLIAGNSSDFLISTSLPAPPAVYVLAPLMRYISIEFDTRWDPKPSRPHVQTFIKMATIALSQDVEWDSLSVSVDGVLFISKLSQKIAGWLRENEYPSGFIPPRTLKAANRNPEEGKKEIWEICSRSSRRIFDYWFDWVAVVELFDTYSEELDLYIGDHSVWTVLVQKLCDRDLLSHQPLHLVSALGALWRRLDARQRAVRVDALSPWNSGLQMTLDTVREEFRSAFRKWDKASQSLDRKLDAFARSASEFLRQNPGFDNTAFIVYMTTAEMDAETPLKYRSFLEEHPHVLDALCLALTSQDTSMAAAAFWVLLRRIPEWLEHNPRRLCSDSVEANVARGLIGTVARIWARSPYRSIERIFDETRPIIEPLLQKPFGVSLVISALQVKNIQAFLALGSSKTPWDAEDAETSSRVAGRIFHAGLRMLLLEWHRSAMDEAQSQESSGVGSVWFAPDSISAVVGCILWRNDYESKDDALDGAIRSYIDKVEALGDDRMSDFGRLQDALIDWRARVQTSREPQEILHWSNEVPNPKGNWL